MDFIYSIFLADTLARITKANSRSLKLPVLVDSIGGGPEIFAESRALKKEIDIAVIIPLEEELHSFQEVFPMVEEISTDPYIELVDSGRDDVSVAVILQDKMGKTAAVRAADHINERFIPKLVVNLGIAGGLSGDLELGDVCYSTRVIDVLDNSKIEDISGKPELKLAPENFETPLRITSSIDLVRRRRKYKDQLQSWADARLDCLSEEEKELTRKSGPISMSGSIVCGAVSASESYNADLKKLDRKILAIDTESGGVFERAKRYGWKALTIRGISDKADSNKEELESSSDGSMRSYAAGNAASFLKILIQTSQEFRDSLSDNTQLGLFVSNEDPTVPTLHEYITTLSDEIKLKLGDLCPEYKLLPKGYILPTPRIRPINHEVDDDPLSSGSDPLDVATALAGTRNVFISVSQTYPEKSLAWIVADELLRSEVNGIQVLPLVSNGNRIRPPKGTLKGSIDLSEKPDFSTEDVCNVIVIDGLPLNSRSKMKHLIQELEKVENTKFVFVDRTPSNIVFENEFAEQLNCDLFELCDVSFAQMAHFVQRNFDMSPTEADVVALRLTNTFKKFQLSAHPSYFAGIPQNTLTSLIQANQRAELMELAVAGFLSFVVAEDKTPVNLSRTSRENFLKDLVILLRVELKKFDHGQLVSHIQSYAKEYGFEISPIDYLNGFLDQNILNFHNGSVSFSLPFMEHYLLARALSEKQELATKYFSSEQLEFDMRTFDLYCEIGPSDTIIKQTIDGITQTVSELFEDKNEQYTPRIWSPEVDQAVASGHKKAKSLSKRIKAASEAIRTGADDREQKQVLLDVTDRVTKRIASEKSSETDENDEALDRIGTIASRWSAAVLLLGSGSEILNAESKKMLSSQILASTEGIIDEMVGLAMTFDFEEIRNDFLDEEFLTRVIERAPDDYSIEDLKDLLNNMIDGLRFINLSAPFHQVINFLCEHARQSVLALSVREAKTDSKLQEFLKQIWLTDIEPSKAKPALIGEIKTLPVALLFRICVSTHLIRRVYWNQSLKSDRLLMLDAAEETLKSTEFSIGKSDFKRLIAREEKLRKTKMSLEQSQKTKG